MTRVGSLVLLAGVLSAGPATAQTVMRCPPDCGPEREQPPELAAPASHLVLAATNMLLGGVTAAARRALDRRPLAEVARGFAGGALGGAAVYGGKVLVSVDAPAVLTGRALAAAGASAVRNAGEGAGLLDMLIIPAGPTRIHVDRRRPPGSRVHVSADLLGLAGLAAAHSLHDDLTLDFWATLASGAPTFRTPTGPYDEWRGRNLAGTIIVLQRHRGRPFPGSGWTAEERMALRHERVHLIQYDQAFIQWSDGVERSLLGWATRGDRLGRHLDLSLHAVAAGLLAGPIPYHRQPWEIEAHSLAGDWGHWQ